MRCAAILLGTVVMWSLSAASCGYRVWERPKLPVRVEVENPGHLQVAVVNVSRRPLAPSELPKPDLTGIRWEYAVQFTDTAGIGVQFREVQATVRSLTGFTATRNIPLASRVERRGSTPISIDAYLMTSNPEERANLTGVQELTFLGQDDGGQPVRVIVRVPLE
jgi:hypothetical protein